LLVEQGIDGYFVGEVAELPGCHTQAKTQNELMERMKEAISIYLEAEKPIDLKFVGMQTLEV